MSEQAIKTDEQENIDGGQEEIKEVVVEPWMESDTETTGNDDKATDNDSEQTEQNQEQAKKEIEETEEKDTDQSQGLSKVVPVKKFVSLKKRLRGEISRQQEEIERLNRENELLKTSDTSIGEPLKRPVEDDFESTEDYEAALDDYRDKRALQTFNRQKKEEEEKATRRKAQERLIKSVDDHYVRAEELISKSGIKPEIYQQSDKTVRTAVDNITPGLGDVIVDQIISILGEGSEKVLYYLGRNQAALHKFQALLSSDPSGMQAAVYLGEEKQRLTNPKKLRTNAPAPAANLKGDAQTSSNIAAMKRKYAEAHKKGDPQAAYNAKKQARLAGADTSDW